MTKLEKTTALIEAMNNVVRYSGMMERYFIEGAEHVTWEQYKEYKERVKENREIIFNLAMGE